MRVSYLFALVFPFLVSASFGDQEVLSPPVIVPESPQDSAFTPVTTKKPTLADLLTIESSASIYFSYARETELSRGFSAVENQWTLLVPTNKAVMALKRKPNEIHRHEGAEPEPDVSEQQYDKQSRENVQRWVAAHIIPCRVSFSDVPLTYNTLLEGMSITFVPGSGGKNSPDWFGITVGDGVHIIDMKEGKNGVIYMIDGTMKPP